MDFSNPALVSAIQGKLQQLIGRDSGYIRSLPKDVKRRINALKNLQNQQAELESKLQEEIRELERKYHGLYEPLYDQRLDFVTGKKEPTDAEATLEDEEEEESDEKADADEAAAESNTTGIPQFWLTAMKTHPHINELITEKDEDALKHITDIRVRDLEDNPGFKLEFFFESNEYFSDSVLTKTYYLGNEGDGDIVYDHAEGTKIQWKEGKDLSVTVETKKQRHKGTNKTRIVKKTVPAETFFNFFNPPQIPDDEEEGDDEEMQDLQERLEDDYGVGELFKLKIIPHAVDWFTGEALAYDMDDEYDEDEGYDDEDDEDEDGEDDDDEDEDEDEAPPPKASKFKSPKGKAGDPGKH